MNNTQKIIKYFALTFAILLIISIFGSIAFSLIHIADIFLGNNDNAILTETKEEIISGDVSELNIDIKSTNLVITKSETASDIKITTNNKYVTSKQNQKRLNIKEKKHYYFGKSTKTTTTITLPDNLKFQNVSIDAGAGTITIDKITTDIFDLDLGAGSVNINDLTAGSKSDIDSGAGELAISNAKINNLNLDLGVGAFTFSGTLTGQNQIDAGVGEVNINLFDNLSNYRLTLDKGIGSITINDEEIKGHRTYGTGTNTIDIDGGVGEININFSRKEVETQTMKVNLDINGTIYEAILEDNATTSALLAMLPLEISMTDLNDNEKYANLNKPLPKNEYHPGKINTGDIMLYGSDTLVIFYDTFDTNYAYTRIGKITDVSSLKENLSQSSSIKITK